MKFRKSGNVLLLSGVLFGTIFCTTPTWAQSDNQLPFALSPWLISDTLTLGGDDLTTEFTITSGSDSEIELQLDSGFDWIYLHTQNLTLPAQESTTFGVTTSCIRPGTKSGHFSVTVIDDVGDTAFIPVQLTCVAPPIVTEILSPIADAEAVEGYKARTSLVWRLNSSWSGHEPVDYTVLASSGVVVTPPSGAVQVNEIMYTSFQYECTAEGDYSFQILPSFDSMLLDWDVSCKSGRPGIRPDKPILEVGADAGTEKMFFITLVNDWDSTFRTDYTLSTETEWLTLLQTSGSMPSPSQDYVLGMAKCTRPGLFIGYIQIHSDQRAVPGTFSFPVVLACDSPPIDITVLEFADRIRAGVQRSANAVLSWTIRSSWVPKENMDFVVDSPEIVPVSDANGTVALEQRIDTPLEYTCGEIADEHEFQITVEVGGFSRSFLWGVSCLDPAAAVIPNVEEISLTVDMTASTTSDFTLSLTNILDANNVVTITGSDSFVQPAESTISIGPLQTESIVVSLTCTNPGTHRSNLELANSQSQQDLQLVPVKLICAAPAFEVTLIQLPSPATTVYPSSATATLIWSLSSLWPDIQPIPYSFTVSTGVSISLSSGSLTPNSASITHTLTYECQGGESIALPLTLTVGGQVHDMSWQVTCIQSQDITALSLEFFQGPLVASMQYVQQDRRWRLQSQRSLAPGLIAGRSVILEVVADHTTSTSESVQFALLQPSKVQQSLVSRNTVQEGSVWRTKSVFYLDNANITPLQSWVLEVPFFLPNDARSQITNSFQDTWNVPQPPAITVRFVPFEGVPPSAEIPIEQYMTEARDYLPFGSLEHELLTVRAIPQNVSDAEDLATFLLNVWEQQGSDPNLLYHGLIGGSDFSPDLCGLADLGGNVAVSRVDTECDSTATVTHEIGHNLSLGHAPCGLEPNGEDEDYPYADGSIGNEYGYFTSSRTRVNSAYDIYDVMSYCSPLFISRYYFSQAGTHLLGRAPATSAALTQTVARLSEPRSEPQPKEVLVISGTLDSSGTWRAKFLTRTKGSQSQLASKPGQTYQLSLLDAGNGSLLASGGFKLRTLSHTNVLMWSTVIEQPGTPDLVLRITNRNLETMYERDLQSILRTQSAIDRPIEIE